MTVLGSGNEDSEDAKGGDKAFLVTEKSPKVEVMVMPGRGRLVSLKRRKSLFTVALVLGFFVVMLAGLFLTICFVRKIGPFRREYHGICLIGSKKFNGHNKVFESYEITDKYALIHVPKFNIKHGSFDSVKTLHVFDKKVTVIQHHNMCFVKPMMKYQMLRNDWFDNLRMLSKHHHFRSPNRFVNFHLQMVRPQLPANYLRDEVDHMADAICNDRPVFRLIFQMNPRPHPWLPKCDIQCNNCDVSQQLHSWKIIRGRKCNVCQCKRKLSKSEKKTPSTPLNKDDTNCKAIRCENKCVIKDVIGCVKCICVDNEHVVGKKPLGLVNTINLPPLIINEEDNHLHDSSYSNVITKEIKSGKKPLGLVNAINLPPLIINEEDNHLHDSSYLNVITKEIKSDNKVDMFKTTDQPVFQERMTFKPIFDYDQKHRNKRSASDNCKIVAKIFEGYTPLDYENKVPLDHIYDC